VVRHRPAQELGRPCTLHLPSSSSWGAWRCRRRPMRCLRYHALPHDVLDAV